MMITMFSYLQLLHLVPRKKIFLEHTLHVDNFIRLLHLRIRERERDRDREKERLTLKMSSTNEYPEEQQQQQP